VKDLIVSCETDLEKARYAYTNTWLIQLNSIIKTTRYCDQFDIKKDRDSFVILIDEKKDIDEPPYTSERMKGNVSR